MRAFCVLMIVTALTSVGDEQAAPVELFFSTPRTEYVIGDPIPVTLQIRARDTSHVLEYRDDAFRNFYRSLRVMGSDGVILRHRVIRDAHAPWENKWGTVETNGSVVKSFDLTDVCVNESASSSLQSLTVTGLYSVSYITQISVRPVGFPSNLWVGTVTSAPLTIKILDVDSDSLKGARQVLSNMSSDRSSRLRALTKMQYSTEIFTKGDFDLLRSVLKTPDESLKIKVIYVLGVKASDEGFKIISGVLATEEILSIRWEAILALKHYDTPAARKFILEECKERLEAYSGTVFTSGKVGDDTDQMLTEIPYRRAVFTLGEVGDESCFGVLQEISKRDVTDDLREMALKSIKKIEERGSKKLTP
jgi:hypothetical protein